MPRKLKVENLSELPESEGRAAVEEDMKAEPVAEPVEVAPVVEPVAEPVPEPVEVKQSEPVPEPKPKAKSKAKAKAKPVKEEVVAEPVKEEVVAEPVKEVEPTKEVPPEPVKKKGEEKVTCPDCGRTVSAKTLKYTHKANCKAHKSKAAPAEQVHSAVCYEKQAEDEQPAHIVEPQPIKPQPSLLEQYEDSIEERMRRLRAQRFQKKQDRLSQLALQAF